MLPSGGPVEAPGTLDRVTALATALVIASALMHATWNLLAKRAAGGLEFLWLLSLVTVVAYLPAAIVYLVVVRPEVTLDHVLLALASAVLHVAYFTALQRGYRSGDLSLVYPLARGSGPLLATLLAVLLLGERPGALALAGTALIVGSVFVLSGGGRTRPGHGAALAYGLLTGLAIGAYTVLDGYAVGHVGAVPLLYLLLADTGRALLLTPSALRRWDVARTTWRTHRREVIGVGLLSPLAYLLVLSALQIAPVSVVAPMREVSILFAAVLGARVLAEGEPWRRALGALGMMAGIALLVLA